MLMVKVQNLTPHPQYWGGCVLPPFTHKRLNGWGELPYPVAKSLKEHNDPEYNVPELPTPPPLTPTEEHVLAMMAEEAAPAPTSPIPAVVFTAEDQRRGPAPFLVLAPCFWGGGGQGQTPVELSRALASMGHPILYYHLPPQRGMKVPSDYPTPPNVYIAQSRYSDNFHKGSRQDIHTEGVDLILMEAAAYGPSGYILVTCPLPGFAMVAEAVRKRLGWKIIYHAVDNWSELPDMQTIGWATKEVGKHTFINEEVGFIQSADYIVSTSRTLAQKFDLGLKEARKNFTVCPHIPNGVDLSYFSGPTPPKPGDLKPGAPTVIYWGNLLGTWIDWQLIFALCNEMPEAQVTLIGKHPPLDKGPLVGHPRNLHFLGFKKITELYAYGKHSHVGIIPFTTGDFSKYVDPIKSKEMLACGLPIIGHGVPDIATIPGAKNTSQHRSFLTAVRNAWANVQSGKRPDASRAANLTWERSARKLLEVLGEDT